MSRIGKKPVDLPKGVKASVSGGVVSVEGPKGTLKIPHRPEVNVETDEQRVSVVVDDSMVGDKKIRALWGTTRALIQNAVTGVTSGYEKKLKIVGVGWNAQVAGQFLKLNVGYANQLQAPIPTGVSVVVEKDIITVTGADKHAVGQFCALVHGMRKPEPYNGKGIHYANRPMRKKEGKKVK
ncbi:MAG: 50S ribosomal protein L6 [Phycisphaerae bacterium]|nr:50S ribosomal protein L6 [Phycisphaerae bacterium]